jgi:uncharacterized protein
MNVVVDANIFISGIYRGGNPRKVLNTLIDGIGTLFITDEIIDEIEFVLKKPKFDLTVKEVKHWITEIEGLGKKVIVSPKYRVTNVCRDRDDNKYLECALAANADYIITGDRDLLDLKEYGGVKIMNARDYLDIVGG